MGTRAKSKLMAKIDSIIEYAQSSNMQYTAKKKMRIISDLDRRRLMFFNNSFYTFVRDKKEKNLHDTKKLGTQKVLKRCNS